MAPVLDPTAAAPLGLRLCAAKPELQARAQPLGRALAAVLGLVLRRHRRWSVAAAKRGLGPGRWA